MAADVATTEATEARQTCKSAARASAKTATYNYELFPSISLFPWWLSPPIPILPPLSRMPDVRDPPSSQGVQSSTRSCHQASLAGWLAGYLASSRNLFGSINKMLECFERVFVSHHRLLKLTDPHD